MYSKLSVKRKLVKCLTISQTSDTHQNVMQYIPAV